MAPSNNNLNDTQDSTGLVNKIKNVLMEMFKYAIGVMRSLTKKMISRKVTDLLKFINDFFDESIILDDKTPKPESRNWPWKF